MDDDTDFREMMEALLASNEDTIYCAANGHAAVQCLNPQQIDLVLLDLDLPDINGIAVMKQLLKIDPTIAIVMVSGQGTIKLAVAATRMGAYDFIEKPVNAHRILLTVKNVLAMQALVQQETREKQDALKKFGMIGRSDSMQRLFATIEVVAPFQTPVLITGESGTGKDVLAQAIHRNSAFKDGPFVQVNCAAIPDTLIESELFGHEKGAFTGAHERKMGNWEQARNGTLFLDEIGDLSLSAQAKILLALEKLEIRRVGGEVPQHVQLRLIAATNKNLEEMVNAGTFREDLYYRIHVLPVALTPLRERLDDVFPLAEYFLAEICHTHALPEKEILKECEPILTAHPWRGNARELKNFIERLAILSPADKISARIAMLALHFEIDIKTGSSRATLREARHTFEQCYIQSALEECDGNVSKTAELLGLDRSHLYKIMDKSEV